MIEIMVHEMGDGTFVFATGIEQARFVAGWRSAIVRLGGDCRVYPRGHSLLPGLEHARRVYAGESEAWSENENLKLVFREVDRASVVRSMTVEEYWNQAPPVPRKSYEVEV